MSTKKEINQGTLTFSVDSSLLFQLGEQLVAKPSVALAELVKNAYDADARHVTVTLENVGDPGGTIIIEDDGHGMTFEEVNKGWMTIATTSKRDNPTSRYFCRAVTGAKGIGRFAARRLGARLLLQSIAVNKSGKKESIHVEFDWKDFGSGRDLITVPVKYSRQLVEDNTSTGVSLWIEDAHDAWTADEIADLQSDLLTLQSPFPDLIIQPKLERANDCQPDPGFDFSLSISGDEKLEEFSGGLSDAFLRGCWATLEGVIQENGKAQYRIDIRENDETDIFEDDIENYEGLEGIRFRIYYFVYRAEYFDHIEFGVREASRKGREEGGVKLYLDNFRVPPYGNEGNDWLELDWYITRRTDMANDIAMSQRVRSITGTLSRPYLLLPANRHLFGAVFISQKEHPNLQITASREGLLENRQFEILRRFLQRGIYWMTIKYAQVTAKRREESRKERKQTNAIETINAARQQAEEIKVTAASGEAESVEMAQQVDSLAATLSQAEEELEEEREDHISEVSMLRLLASAGTMLILMNHQLQALIGAVSQTEQDLLRLRPEIPSRLADKYDDIHDQLSEWHKMVKAQVSQLGFLLSPDSRERRKRVALHEDVSKVGRSMGYYMKTYNVEFKNETPRDLRTPPIYRAELYSILLNIFSNALKAVHGQHKRLIAVDAEKKDGIMVLRMLDTGKGLPKDKREEAFEPFQTTSAPNPILGVGTGLGLTVVRDILNQYNGEARFIDAPPPWKTCIEISLPYPD